MEKEKDTILFIKATVAKKVIFNQKHKFFTFKLPLILHFVKKCPKEKKHICISSPPSQIWILKLRNHLSDKAYLDYFGN